MPVDIAIAVVEWNGAFLIAPRPTGAALAGLWEFPGGKVEGDETCAAAAVRECREETGLEVVVTGSYAAQEETYAHGQVRLHFFACQPIDPAAVPLPPFRWTPRAELGNYEFPAGNRALLAELLRGGRRPPSD